MDTTATADDPPTTTTTAAAAAPTTLTREQQREARRQKVLARSNLSGSASPVVDLASQSQVGVGMSAAIDDDPAVPSLVDDGVDTTATAKSGARLAAERRRQRILSKSNERMAKVQGDRVGHGGGSAADGDTGADDGDGAGAGGLDEVSYPVIPSASFATGAGARKKPATGSTRLSCVDDGATGVEIQCMFARWQRDTCYRYCCCGLPY